MRLRNQTYGNLVKSVRQSLGLMETVKFIDAKSLGLRYISLENEGLYDE